MNPSLTTQQELFIKHIRSGSSAEVAACLAGYSERFAKKISQKLLKNPRIVERLGEKVEPVAELFAPVSNADWVLMRMESIADFSINRVADVGADGMLEFRPLNEWSDADARCVKKVRSTIATKPDGTRFQAIEFEFHDKVQALEKLGRYHGMFRDFENAIATLKNYGINLIRDSEGRWVADNA